MKTKKEIERLFCATSCEAKTLPAVPCKQGNQCRNICYFIDCAEKMGLIAPPEKAWFVKPEAEIRRILADHDYAEDSDGDWIDSKTIRVFILKEMFSCCGKKTTDKYSWDSSWLELREVEE